MLCLGDTQFAYEASVMADDIDKDEFLEMLRSQVGKTGSPMVARDPVNQSTIRNWCDAMAEHNPYYGSGNS